MDFYDWPSYWNHFRKTAAADSPDPFYAELCQIGLMEATQGLSGSSAVCNQALAERYWYKRGQPYYKLYPQMIHLLMQTQMNVPSQFLHTPFAAFCIRFPKGHQIEGLTVNGKEIRSILVDETRGRVQIDQPDNIDQRRNITAWMDFGETESDINPGTNNAPVTTYLNMQIQEDIDIESCLPGQDDMEGSNGLVSNEGLPIPSEVCTTCFRIVVAICFLATGADKIIQPEVLAKDFRKYQEGDQATRERLVNKSHRRGKKGWTVGREISFPHFAQTQTTGNKSGRELQYTHLRAAHFHLYWTGPGKTVPTIKFITQQTIRPDLPLAPNRRGYKSNAR